MPLNNNDIALRIRTLVEGGLVAKGVSGRRASIDVVGHDGLIRDIRAGRLPGIDKLEVLFAYLGIGFHLGPETVDAGSPVFEIDGDDFATVKRVGALASAGPGALNGDAEVIGSMAFRRDWLRERGIKPEKALLVTVTGDSMKPSISPGDLVLLDQARTEIVNGAPFIFVDADGETRLKRLHRLGRNTVALVSDNPDHPPELRNGVDAERVKVLGRVVWSGHNWE